MAKTKKKTTSKEQNRETTQVKKRTSSQLKKKTPKQTPQNTKRTPKARGRTGAKYGAGRKYFLDDNAFVIKQNTKLK